MNRPLISLVVAIARNGVIGQENDLPWRLPDDLKRFKEITLGKPVVMGRKTFESIGKPLPGRENRVISRRQEISIPGCQVYSSLQDALSGPQPEIMVIGGGQIYAEALPLAQRLYLTEVDVEAEGDVYFPKIDPLEWHEVSKDIHPADPRHRYGFVYRVLERDPSPRAHS